MLNVLTTEILSHYFSRWRNDSTSKKTVPTISRLLWHWRLKDWDREIQWRAQLYEKRQRVYLQTMKSTIMVCKC